MKKQITMVVSLGIIIAFAAGLFLGRLLPIDTFHSTEERILLGDRSHLIGSWKGPLNRPRYPCHSLRMAVCCSLNTEGILP